MGYITVPFIYAFPRFSISGSSNGQLDFRACNLSNWVHQTIIEAQVKKRLHRGPPLYLIGGKSWSLWLSKRASFHARFGQDFAQKCYLGIYFWGIWRWWSVAFAGLTSTLMGNKDSFLPQLGHFPSCWWIISSGGLSSAPSYKMWLQPWQITFCGTVVPCDSERNTLHIFIDCYFSKTRWR